jgi:TP901 family phage tail tape measure protein
MPLSQIFGTKTAGVFSAPGMRMFEGAGMLDIKDLSSYQSGDRKNLYQKDNIKQYMEARKRLKTTLARLSNDDVTTVEGQISALQKLSAYVSNEGERGRGTIFENLDPLHRQTLGYEIKSQLSKAQTAMAPETGYQYGMGKIPVYGPASIDRNEEFPLNMQDQYDALHSKMEELVKVQHRVGAGADALTGNFEAERAEILEQISALDKNRLAWERLAAAAPAGSREKSMYLDYAKKAEEDMGHYTNSLLYKRRAMLSAGLPPERTREYTRAASKSFVTNDVGSMPKGFQGNAMETAGQFGGMQEGLSPMGMAARRVAYWGSAAYMIYGTIRALSTMVRQVVELDKVFHGLEAVMRDVNKDMNLLKNAAFDIAASYGRTTTEIVTGMTEIAKTGADQTTILKLTRIAALAANVAEIDMADSAKILTAAQKQFKLSTEEVIGVVDSWNEVSRKARVTTGDLVAGMQAAGTAAGEMGVSYHQLNSLVATVAEATGKSGEEIGTAFKAMMAREAMPKAVSALQSAGVSTTDLSGNLKDFDVILGDVAGKWDSLTRSQQMNIANAMAEKKRYQYFIALMENWDRYLDNIGVSMDSAGSAEKENAIIMESLSKQFERFTAVLEQTKYGITGFLQTIAGVAMPAITSLINFFNMLLRIPGANIAISLMAIAAAMSAINKIVIAKAFEGASAGIGSTLAYGLSAQTGWGAITGSARRQRNLVSRQEFMGAQDDMLAQHPYQDVLWGKDPTKSYGNVGSKRYAMANRYASQSIIGIGSQVKSAAAGGAPIVSTKLRVDPSQFGEQIESAVKSHPVRKAFGSFGKGMLDFVFSPAMIATAAITLISGIVSTMQESNRIRTETFGGIIDSAIEGAQQVGDEYSKQKTSINVMNDAYENTKKQLDGLESGDTRRVALQQQLVALSNQEVAAKEKLSTYIDDIISKYPYLAKMGEGGELTINEEALRTYQELSKTYPMQTTPGGKNDLAIAANSLKISSENFEKTLKLNWYDSSAGVGGAIGQTAAGIFGTKATRGYQFTDESGKQTLFADEYATIFESVLAQLGPDMLESLKNGQTVNIPADKVKAIYDSLYSVYVDGAENLEKQLKAAIRSHMALGGGVGPGAAGTDYVTKEVWKRFQSGNMELDEIQQYLESAKMNWASVLEIYKKNGGSPLSEEEVKTLDTARGLAQQAGTDLETYAKSMLSNQSYIQVMEELNGLRENEISGIKDTADTLVAATFDIEDFTNIIKNMDTIITTVGHALQTGVAGGGAADFLKALNIRGKQDVTAANANIMTSVNMISNQESQLGGLLSQRDEYAKILSAQSADTMEFLTKIVTDTMGKTLADMTSEDVDALAASNNLLPSTKQILIDMVKFAQINTDITNTNQGINETYTNLNTLAETAAQAAQNYLALLNAQLMSVGGISQALWNAAISLSLQTGNTGMAEQYLGGLTGNLEARKGELEQELNAGTLTEAEMQSFAAGLQQAISTKTQILSSAAEETSKSANDYWNNMKTALEHFKTLNRITIDQYVEGLKYLKEVAPTLADKLQMEEEIYKAEQEQSQQQMEYGRSWVDHEKALELMNTSQQLAYMKQLREMATKREDKWKLEEEIFSLEKQAIEDRVGKAQTWLDHWVAMDAITKESQLKVLQRMLEIAKGSTDITAQWGIEEKIHALEKEMSGEDENWSKDIVKRSAGLSTPLRISISEYKKFMGEGSESIEEATDMISQFEEYMKKFGGTGEDATVVVQDLTEIIKQLTQADVENQMSTNNLIGSMTSLGSSLTAEADAANAASNATQNAATSFQDMITFLNDMITKYNELQDKEKEVFENNPTIKGLLQFLSGLSGGVTPTGGQTQGSTASSFAMFAASMGAPYHYGGEGPSSCTHDTEHGTPLGGSNHDNNAMWPLGCFDCSGLVKWSYGKAGKSLTHYSGAQYNESTTAAIGTPMGALMMQPGSLLWPSNPGQHVGMYVGNGTVVEASHTGDPVIQHPFTDKWKWVGIPKAETGGYIAGGGLLDVHPAELIVKAPIVEKLERFANNGGASYMDNSTLVIQGTDMSEQQIRNLLDEHLDKKFKRMERQFKTKVGRVA